MQTSIFPRIQQYIHDLSGALNLPLIASSPEPKAHKVSLMDGTHWGGEKIALGFGADQIRTLVSMATDSSHRVIMGKRASSRFLDCI